MDSPSATASSHLLTSHPLPHQQFSSRIAFANNYSKLRISSLTHTKSTLRLPPITRFDSTSTPPTTNDSIRYFNVSADGRSGINGTDGATDGQSNNRMVQLERNLRFVQQDCQQILESLQQELEELKSKNRDLQFQLIANGSEIGHKEVLVMPLIKEPGAEEHIHKLENEVRRLRAALGETLRINALLRQELQTVKNNRRQTIGNVSNGNVLSSPMIGEFNKTFAEINKTFNNSNQKPNSGSKVK